MKPGSCTLPFYGIDVVVLDPATGQVLEGNGVEGVLAIRQPWPGMTRTCLGDHERYLTVYMKPYPGYVTLYAISTMMFLYIISFFQCHDIFIVSLTDGL
jgi:acyl-coenzyme A synthetase/AMP-(fatty) acid ligase